MRNLWRDHSLSVVFLGAGIPLWAVSQFLPEGGLKANLFDFGVGAILFGIFGLAQGPLREKNKPEEPPEDGK